MIKYRILFFLALFHFSSLSFPQIQDERIRLKTTELKQVREKEKEILKEIEAIKFELYKQDLLKIGYPKSKEELQIIEHSVYFVGHSCNEKLAAWSYHMITPDVLKGSEGRTNDFRKDSNAECVIGEQDDYFLVREVNGKNEYDGFGFDRGHLAPAADFRWSQKAVSESFYYSNMTPQRPEFNRGSWAYLEDRVRNLVAENPANYYIVSGPILHEYDSLIGRGINKLPIPTRFFKAILRMDNNPKAIAFVVPNTDFDTDRLSTYAISIDSLEELTDLDLFPNIEKELQEKIEANMVYSDWNFQLNIGDVEPLRPDKLEAGNFSTLNAKVQKNSGKEIYVIGKVVGTHVVKSTGTIILNLDKSYPNEIFTIYIKAEDLINFSYSPDKEFKGRYVRVHCKVSGKGDKVSTNISNEKQIELYQP